MVGRTRRGGSNEASAAGLYAWIANHSTLAGASLIGAGVVLLLSLRFWASPVARRITGADPAGFAAFLGIPLFFALAGGGIALFLWEPDRE